MKTPHNERFWSSTRGRIVVLLRGAVRTVGELAQALELTDNAVRAHLTALERDGLVQLAGSRKGVRKPNLTYQLSPEAGHLFPREYASVLSGLLDVLKVRMPTAELVDVLRAVGHRMASRYRAVAGPDAEPTGHLDRGLAVLHDLGGFCQSEAREGGVVLSCRDCPLAAVATTHPEVCRLVETVLADVLDATVRERCEPPRCEFEVARPEG